MNRQHKHQAERAVLARRLRHMGFVVQGAPQPAKYDLLIGGRVRLAIRVASAGRYKHNVTVNGKRYAYDYTSWNFNFHRHGRWDRDYCDLFVCIAKRPRGEDEVFVIPSDKVSGPTFSLHGSGKPYQGRYATFRHAWEQLHALLQRDGSDPEEAVA